MHRDQKRPSHPALFSVTQNEHRGFAAQHQRAPDPTQDRLAFMADLAAAVRRGTRQRRILLLEVDRASGDLAAWRCGNDSFPDGIERACLAHFGLPLGGRKLAVCNVDEAGNETREPAPPPKTGAPLSWTLLQPCSPGWAISLPDPRTGIVHIIAVLPDDGRALAAGDGLDGALASQEILEGLLLWKDFREAYVQRTFGGVLAELAPWGFVVLNGSGQIVFANAHAREMAERAKRMSILGDHLHFDHAATERSFQKILLNVTQAEQHAGGEKLTRTALSVSDDEGIPQYAVTVIPHQCPHPAPGMPAAVVTLTDLRGASCVREAVLADLFSLSGKEAQLAELFATGYSLGDAAMTMGISRHTARIHLYNILWKTGAANQVDLARLLARLPAPFPLPAVQPQGDRCLPKSDQVDEQKSSNQFVLIRSVSCDGHE